MICFRVHILDEYNIRVRGLVFWRFRWIWTIHCASGDVAVYSMATQADGQNQHASLVKRISNIMTRHPTLGALTLAFVLSLLSDYVKRWDSCTAPMTCIVGLNYKLYLYWIMFYAFSFCFVWLLLLWHGAIGGGGGGGVAPARVTMK